MVASAPSLSDEVKGFQTQNHYFTNLVFFVFFSNAYLSKISQCVSSLEASNFVYCTFKVGSFWDQFCVLQRKLRQWRRRRPCEIWSKNLSSERFIGHFVSSPSRTSWRVSSSISVQLVTRFCYSLCSCNCVGIECDFSVFGPTNFWMCVLTWRNICFTSVRVLKLQSLTWSALCVLWKIGNTYQLSYLSQAFSWSVQCNPIALFPLMDYWKSKTYVL